MSQKQQGGAKKSDAKPDVSYHIRVAMLGDAHVGKTRLLLRYTEDGGRTSTDYTADMRTKMLVRNGRLVKLDVRDTAGLERYRSLTRSHYTGIIGALLVFDLTKEQSFLHLTYWQHELHKHAGETVPALLVGTNCHKKDDQEVAEDRARQFADHHGMQYVEVSSSENINVELCFERLVDKVIEKHSDEVKVQGKDRIKLKSDDSIDGATCSSCCGTFRLKEPT